MGATSYIFGSKPCHPLRSTCPPVCHRTILRSQLHNECMPDRRHAFATGLVVYVAVFNDGITASRNATTCGCPGRKRWAWTSCRTTSCAAVRLPSNGSAIPSSPATRWCGRCRACCAGAKSPVVVVYRPAARLVAQHSRTPLPPSAGMVHGDGDTQNTARDWIGSIRWWPPSWGATALLAVTDFILGGTASSILVIAPPGIVRGRGGCHNACWSWRRTG